MELSTIIDCINFDMLKIMAGACKIPKNIKKEVIIEKLQNIGLENIINNFSKLELREFSDIIYCEGNIKEYIKTFKSANYRINITMTKIKEKELCKKYKIENFKKTLELFGAKIFNKFEVEDVLFIIQNSCGMNKVKNLLLDFLKDNTMPSYGDNSGLFLIDTTAPTSNLLDAPTSNLLDAPTSNLLDAPTSTYTNSTNLLDVDINYVYNLFNSNKN